MKNPVEHDRPGGHDSFTVHGVENLKGASVGRGLVYSWIQGVGEDATLNCQFALVSPAPAGYTIKGQGQIVVEFDPRNNFPCAGIVTSNGEGYLIAPAIRLDLSKGRGVVLMLLSPPTKPHNVSLEKNILTIHGGDATVTLTTGNGELRCLGVFSAQSKKAEVILNRNPRLPVYKAGFNETLGKLKGSGQIKTIWKPVSRSFEELVLVFDPSTICSLRANSLSFDRVQSLLSGTEQKGAENKGDYVIGDGIGVSYTIRLLIHRSVGRHFHDQARLVVT